MLRHRWNGKSEELARSPFFAHGSTAERLALAKAADVLKAQPGDVLVHEGRRGNEFFAILDGIAEVRRDGNLVATLGPGDCFGELALLDGGTRTATVIASTEVELAVVDGRLFGPLLVNAPAFTRTLLAYLAQRLRGADERAVAA
jgi:CRP/FNR family transcriptional regulator, cyclic AMP receptor protein